MPSRRPAIPRPARERVLSEFCHRCAICGGEKPQVHHIDENPTNNDLLNLLPLCPNCHLTDQHNPTAPMDPAKLALFRKFKDPTILSPQFEPLFARFRFLNNRDESIAADTIGDCIEELVAFVRSLSMGQFYGDKIASLLKMPMQFGVLVAQLPEPEYQRHRAEHNAECLAVLDSGREEVLRLVIELLRYQPWSRSK